jgi:DNA-binding CsgD family transcriptional regulator
MRHGAQEFCRQPRRRPPAFGNGIRSDDSKKRARESTLRLADEFAALATALLVARGGFAAKQLALPGKKLTPREIEILNWVGKGKQNIEIASILGRSPHTIRKHLENIFSKLGVETRTAAVDGLRDTPRQSST